MAVIKCKMCGGDLTLSEGSIIARCAYCGTEQTVPSADNEKKLKLFDRANKLRYGCEFDKAAGVYESIVADFPEEPEAYWGLVLCKFGIEYVDDPGTQKKIPTCHRSSFESVFDDENFQLALENADALARKLYREEAKLIEELRKGIIEVSSKEDPFDIFICYKETAADGQRTLDSVLAQDLYDVLTEKGYRVFFARITLEDKLGQEFEPYIFAALNSARIMLAVGTDYEHFNAVWVRNEWSRYLELIAKGEKKTLIPCYKGIDAYDMPREFAKLQAQDLGKVGGIQDLLRGIDKVIQPTATHPVSTQSGTDITRLLELGNEALQEKNWKNAMNRFDLALLADPDCAEAYIGKLMAEKKLTKREALQKSKKRLDKSQNFREAIRCAGDSLRQELEDWNKKVKKAILKRWIIRASVFVCLLLTAVTAMEITFRVTISRVNQETITPREAFPVLNALSWYKGYPQELYLAALDAKDYETARLYEPQTLTLNATTLGIFTTSTLPSSNVEHIIIEPGVTEIPKNAFRDYEPLETVTIPDSVTSIGEYAFSGCTALKAVNLSKNIQTIEKRAFEGCTALTNITIPDSVTSIGEYAFRDCTALQTVKLSQNIQTIERRAFEGCTNLSEIVLPEQLHTMGDYAFANCTALGQIDIPKSLKVIPKSAFGGCTSLYRVTIPEGVEEIKVDAFGDCAITEIIIPGSVVIIGAGAFNKSKLETIYCKAASQPDGWSSTWKTGTTAYVHWGA